MLIFLINDESKARTGGRVEGGDQPVWGGGSHTAKDVRRTGIIFYKQNKDLLNKLTEDK